MRTASSPDGGDSSCSQRDATCLASRGLGAMFCVARSATCASYSVRNVDAARVDRPAMDATDAGRRDPVMGARTRDASARDARGAAIAPVAILDADANPLPVDGGAGARAPPRSRRRRSARPFTVRIITILRVGKEGGKRRCRGQRGGSTRVRPFDRGKRSGGAENVVFDCG